MRTTEVCGAGVRFGSLPAHPFGAADHPVAFPVLGGTGNVVATRRRALLHLERYGRLLIDDGQLVTVELDDGVDPEVSLPYNGTVAALVLAQRGEFALHAGSVVIGGTTVALAGRSGAGKSTTSLALDRAGHRMLSDDISVVTAGGRASADGGPETGASVRTYRRAPLVLPDAAERLGVDLGGADVVRRIRPKFALAEVPSAEAPLHAVVELVADPDCAEVGLERLRGAEAVEVIHRHVFRRPALDPLWGEELAAFALAVARCVAAHRLRRPAVEWTLEAVVDRLERLPVVLSR